MLHFTPKRWKNFFSEKTVLPVIFLVVVTIANFFFTHETISAKKTLPAKQAEASDTLSGTNVMIAESTLKSNSYSPFLETNSFAVYNKFLKSNFIIPTTGKNWGLLHGENGIDIANTCGKNIYAADDGLVMETKQDYWNGGYGNYLIIDHGNGVKTKYAHLQKIKTKQGNYVLQGDPIATIGNTGLTSGRTGCHLHFEVLGWRNPFVQ